MAAKRAFVSVSTKSKYWAQACNSVAAAIDVALNLLKQQELVSRDAKTPRLLVVERWGSRTHIVFDIHHDTYRPEKAHLPSEGNLPVIAVWLSTEEKVQIATQGLRDKVNDEVRQWHTLQGAECTPPFLFDRSSGAFPTFMKPQATATELSCCRTNMQ